MSRFNLIGIEVDLKYILIHTCIINTCILSFKSALISPFNFLLISPLKFACIYKLSLWYKNRAKLGLTLSKLFYKSWEFFILT